MNPSERRPTSFPESPTPARNVEHPSARDAAISEHRYEHAPLIATIATIVSRIRRNSRMEIEDLAAASGIPADALRDIEAGRVVPTLRALWALAHVFEVPFRLLISGPRFQDRGFHVLRSDSGRTVVSDGGRFRSRALSAAGDPREPEAYEITLAPGCVEQASPHSGDTFEHVVVVRGRLRISAGTADATLRAGDALFFCADVPHSYENPGPAETVALLTMTNGGDWVVA